MGVKQEVSANVDSSLIDSTMALGGRRTRAQPANNNLASVRLASEKVRSAVPSRLREGPLRTRADPHTGAANTNARFCWVGGKRARGRERRRVALSAPLRPSQPLSTSNGERRCSAQPSSRRRRLIESTAHKATEPANQAPAGYAIGGNARPAGLSERPRFRPLPRQLGLETTG